ncbi:hypothetical protein BLOT_008815 [Blomia tropicalis]|nr:hypothetical protein BLOT_008815 [Blomia tropicalis]
MNTLFDDFDSISSICLLFTLIANKLIILLTSSSSSWINSLPPFFSVSINTIQIVLRHLLMIAAVHLL